MESERGRGREWERQPRCDGSEAEEREGGRSTCLPVAQVGLLGVVDAEEVRRDRDDVALVERGAGGALPFGGPRHLPRRPSVLVLRSCCRRRGLPAEARFVLVDCREATRRFSRALGASRLGSVRLDAFLVDLLPLLPPHVLGGFLHLLEEEVGEPDLIDARVVDDVVHRVGRRRERTTTEGALSMMLSRGLEASSIG